MTLSNLEQAMQQQADQEARSIVDQVRKAGEARFERESARLREEHERRVASARTELESELEREASARETSDRLKLLQIKNEILEAVFNGAVDKIRSLPDDGYAEWMKRQLTALPSVSGNRIVVKKQDNELAKRLLNEIGQDKGLSLDESPARIQAGFQVRGEQADLDYSVEVLLGVLREKLSQEIATRLFGEETD